MWRRLIREDLVSTSPLREGRRSYEFVWYRADGGYRLVEQYGGEPYFEAIHTDEPGDVSFYQPLVATLHLFLEFARLQERKDVDGAILGWIENYGLLGLELLPPRPFREGVPWAMQFVAEHSPEGGPGETLSKVRAEVEVANGILTLYEATLSKGVNKLEKALRVDGASPGARRGRKYFRSESERRGITYPEALVDGALRIISEDVQQVLEAFTYPCLAHHSPSENPPIDHVWTLETMKSSLWPRNLLGAMYLQFLWLVDSAGELSRCKYCNRDISHAPPLPKSGDRKLRKDKEFCNERCRQNYHYHNRIKPKRS